MEIFFLTNKYFEIVVSIHLENQDVEASNARFVLHAVQLVPDLNCKSGTEYFKLVNLQEQASEGNLAFAVKVFKFKNK